MPTSYYRVLAQGSAAAGRTANTVTNKALTSNVVTLTTSTAHGYVAGDQIIVSGVDQVCDGGFTVASAPTTTTLTYARTASNITSAAVTPNGTITGGTPRSFAYVNNLAVTSNIATLTTAANHGFVAGDTVVVSGVNSAVDGTVVVASAPGGTTFTYPVTTATIASAAVSPTGVAMRLPSAGVTVSNRGSINNTVQLTTGAAHNCSVDDYIQVQIGVANVDGYWRVTGVPNSTSISYATTASGAIASGASFAGALSKRAWSGILYTVPTSGSTVLSTITIASRDTAGAFYRLAAIPYGETFNDSDFIAYNASLASFDTVTLTLGMTMASRDQLYFWSSSPLVTFTVYGVETI